MVAPLDISDNEEQEQYGNKLEFEPSGPFEKARSRTDHCWFLSFIIYLVLWGLVAIYAFKDGDINRWLEPTDSAGRVCGRDPGVSNKSHLLEYNLNSCEYPNCLVCQEKCPTANFTYSNRSSSNEDTLEKRMKLMICKPEVKLANISTWDQLDYLVDRQLCAREYEASNTTKRLCNDDDEDREEHRSRFHDWRHTVTMFNKDLEITKYSIIGFVVLSSLIALFSILIMRWHAVFYVCGSVFVFYVLVFDYIYNKCVVEAESKTLGALLSLVIFVTVLILIVVVAIYFWRQIYLACQMIRESSKAITCMMSTLLIPLAVLFFYLIILTIGVKTHFYLTATMETPVYRVDLVDKEACMCPETLAYLQNSTCSPYVFEDRCRTEKGEECVLSGCRMVDKRRTIHVSLHFLNFLGIYWTYWFALGFLDTILASVFATWYWTCNKKLLTYLSVVESFWRITRYHLGSVAFGSLIMFFCQIIRFSVSTSHKVMLKINDTMAELAVANFPCLFDSVDKFFYFVNQRAYIACAIHGSDFLQSGRTSFYLLMRNVEKVVVVFEFTNWLIMFLTILISCITTRLSSSYFASREDLTYPYALTLVVFTGSMLAAWLILRIVDVAVNTMFQCFLADSERNDASYQKPYFMHDELTKFLYKK